MRPIVIAIVHEDQFWPVTSQSPTENFKGKPPDSLVINRLHVDLISIK